jgi:PTS system mannose-specific IIB component
VGSLWVRVDDRLIHGQVTVGWRQYLRYAEIWVVDEQARGDPYLRDALRLAAPEGVEVRVYGVEEAVALLRPPPRPSPVTSTEADKDVGGRTTGEGAARLPPDFRGGVRGGCVLLLVKSPEAALALVEGGVPLERLNVGNLSARPGSVRAFKNISLTRAHVEALDALAGRGVRITFQLAPEDAHADWQTVRGRLLS